MFIFFKRFDLLGQNQFGLKYLDTSSLEFGRKLPKDSSAETFSSAEVSGEKFGDSIGLTNKNNQPDQTISSSLSVSSSETVQIETSLADQDLVKPSRVKKRNFSSKDPVKSANILKSHVDSNNFRHTSNTTPVQEDAEVIFLNN